MKFPKLTNPLTRLDAILLTSLSLIGGGVYQQLGTGPAMLSVGVLLLLLGLLMAKGQGAE